MARGVRREVILYVPQTGQDDEDGVPRLQAPKSLWTTTTEPQKQTKVFSLPVEDSDKNQRPWHAKMLGLRGDRYSALMIGSSNFTCAGMGIGPARNAEANLLTIVDRSSFAREVGAIEQVWPKGTLIEDPDSAEWLGAKVEDEQDEAMGTPVPTVPRDGRNSGR